MVPAIEARLTIQPFDSRRSGIVACVTRMSPRRLTSSCRSSCFRGRSSTRPPNPTPAELTSTSRRPNRSRCSATTFSQSSASATFAATAKAPSSDAAASTRSGRREASVRSKPSSRNIRAIASPIPDEPPVTSAARPIAPTVDGVEIEAAGLTSLTVGGGCAAKYSAARLEELLKGFVPAEAEDLLVGLHPADDAAVYRLDDERALVFTVDFFPPLVDDPALFGRIAATNALNDVFAMGGTPLLALSVAAFPEELPTGVLAAVFAAADEQVRAAGAILAGGHTIRDAEPKYGLAVVGTVHPDAIWPKNGARPGDALFLTKPLGTGLVLSGYKQGLAGLQQLERPVRWMRTLNKDAAELLRARQGVHPPDRAGRGRIGSRRPLMRQGMIHGRFQPFHNGHLEYLSGAAERSDELWIGITNPDPARVKPEESDPLRHLPESNPYSYAERLLMAEAAASDAGLDPQRVHVVPFPVNEPELWDAYVPRGVTQFLRLFSDWGG